MSIKQILALAVIVVGILLNLKLQDAMALAGNLDGQPGSAVPSPWDQRARVSDDGRLAAAAGDGAVGLQRNGNASRMLAATPRQDRETTPVDESDCE